MVSSTPTKKASTKRSRSCYLKNQPFLDAVIDSAGGTVAGNIRRLLKIGGVAVTYGMTTMDQPALPMQAVMKNIELKGSTMGSRRECHDTVGFVKRRK